MILRRFMQHIKEQNWFAVGLDVVVVIVGIFLGMQVSEWYEHRKENELEISYYQQLIQDLKIDQQDGMNAVRYNDENYANGQYLYNALIDSDFSIDDPNKIVVAIMRAGFLYEPQIANQTYKELTNTGYLRLIEDVELKRAIVNYYARLESRIQWNTTARQVQAIYRTHSAGLVKPEIVRKYRLDEEYSFSELDALKLLESARQRTELLDILSHMADYQTMNRNAGKRKAETAQTLEKLLANKISTAK